MLLYIVQLNRQIVIEEKAQKAFGLEKAEFKTPSLASLKKKFPNTPINDLKKKILSALASQLEDIEDEDFMSITSQTAQEKNAPLIDVDGAIISERDYVEDDTKCIHLNNEDM